MTREYRYRFFDSTYPRLEVYDSSMKLVARVSWGRSWKLEGVGTNECYPIGYSVESEFQGRGLMTWTLKLFLRKCRKNHFQACVLDNNIASQRVLEKCGFKLVGTGSIYHYEYRKDSQYETISNEKRGPVDSHPRWEAGKRAA